MEDKFFTKLNTTAKDMHLDPAKKEEIKGALIRYMDASSAIKEREIARHRSYSLMSFFKPMVASAMIAVMVLTGGGISAAAERALPGDALYGIKVHVNEEVRAAFAVGDENETAWEIRRAERRLEEAEKLAERGEGEIDAEIKADLEARFAEHAERVEDRIEKFETEGNVRVATDIASRFETSLDAHANILARLEERRETIAVAKADANAQAGSAVSVQAGATLRASADESQKGVRPIEVRVRKVADKVMGVRVSLEAKMKAQDSGSAVVETKPKENPTLLKVRIGGNKASTTVTGATSLTAGSSSQAGVAASAGVSATASLESTSTGSSTNVEMNGGVRLELAP